MTVVDDLYYWTDVVVFWALIAFAAWAFIDCVIRSAAAFPAVDRMTKPAWLMITGLSVVVSVIGLPLFISLIATVACAVYLADVRPAVREVSGGSRW